MVVTDEEGGIEDELEILSPFAKQGRFIVGEFGLENYKFQGGSLIEVVAGNVIFPISLTLSNLESWNSRYKYKSKKRSSCHPCWHIRSS